MKNNITQKLYRYYRKVSKSENAYNVAGSLTKLSRKEIGKQSVAVWFSHILMGK